MTFMRRVRYAFETVAAYLIYGFFWLLPVSAASDLGGFLMRHIGPRMGITRVARKNLELAFPEKPAAQLQLIIIGMWDNLGRVIAEYPHLRKIWSRVELVGAEHLVVARESGKPAIFLADISPTGKLTSLPQK